MQAPRNYHWVKKGMIYRPSGEAAWMKSHAQGPTALVMEDRLRIYITVRPEMSTSLITYIDVQPDDPARILYVHKEPLLPLGTPGTFDEFGMTTAAVLPVGDEVWLYYTGWQRGQTVSYILSVGLAISRDGGKSFERAFIGPLLSTTPHEPFSAMAPCVLQQGDDWHMWYGSGVGWVQDGTKYEPTYCIYYAHSHDGVHWQRPNICCIPGKTPGEANTRPWVIYEDGLYHMWFSYRGDHDYRDGAGSYRIGYACSADGKVWQRRDERFNLVAGPEEWDSKMMAHPNIVDTPYGRYMFYNGNGFGAGGFGYATLAEGK